MSAEPEPSEFDESEREPEEPKRDPSQHDEPSTDDFADDESLIAWALARLPNQRRAGALVADRYELVDMLGRGGQGSVWHAIDRNLGSPVAMKFVDALRYAPEQLDRLFRLEKDALVEGLRKCGTADIARILDAGQSGDERFLVMELIQGKSLQELVEELAATTGPGELPPLEQLQEAVGRATNESDDIFRGAHRYERAVAKLIETLLDALWAVHSAGIVHRDLKLPNVLLRKGGRPVLVDFGIAALAGVEADEGGLSGTMHMLAPEQILNGQTGRDPRTDIYQAGLLLYVLLSLQEAFDAKKQDLVLGDILECRFERLSVLAPQVSPKLAEICERAFSKDPEQRFQTSRDFRDAIRAWLREQELPPWEPDRYETTKVLWRDERIERVDARDTRTGAQVFIETTGELLRERCRNEFDYVARTVRALSQIEHARVLSYRDIALGDDGVPRVVLKARPGRWLNELLEQDGPMSAPQIRQLGIDLGQALLAMHTSGDGHIHRGLEAAHILIEDDGGRAAVAGFSFVKPNASEIPSMISLQSGFEDNPWIALPRYTAPEQLSVSKSDFRVDLFALGCVLHLATTGQDPEQDDSGARTIADEKALKKRLGRQPTALILKCLAIEKSMRPGNAKLFLDAWQSSRFGSSGPWWGRRGS